METVVKEGNEPLVPTGENAAAIKIPIAVLLLEVARVAVCS